MNDSHCDAPTLRSDLTWTMHQFADGPGYSVLNPTTGLNYQMGVGEYAFASMLDGQTSIRDAAEATRRLAESSGRDELAIDDRQGALIANWLVKMKLATQPSDGDSSVASETRQSRRLQISPLSVKVRLADPNPLVRWIGIRTRWLTGRCALFVYLVMIAAAAMHVALNLQPWQQALSPLADPTRWWAIGAAAVALRVLHELAHGVVANRFGVRVTEFGVLWILLVPLPYVDVSRSWQRNRRRERILIGAAGMLAELIVASIAVAVFASTSSEWTRHVAATIAVTASAVTLLFNANILMRFDGYHMLVDAVRYPNLYSDALAYWRNLAQRLVVGKRPPTSHRPLGWLGVWMRVYGIAVLLWRVIVLVGLILAAEHLLGGMGVLIALTAVIAIAVRFVSGLPRMFQGVRPVRALVGVTICVACAVAIWRMPLSNRSLEQGIAQHRDPVHVRTGCDGFVREILVGRGQRVRPGDALAVLENAELTHDVSILNIELAASQLRYRRFLSDNELASAAAQWSLMRQLQQQLSRRQRQCDALTVRATKEGIVAGPDSLKLWLGRHVQEGTELMQIVQEQALEVVVMVQQSDRSVLANKIGHSMSVRRPIDWRADRATLTEVAPQATDRLSNESLGAHQGGSLAVRPITEDSDEVRLLEPRFEARLRVENDSPLRDGQRIWVTMQSETTTVGDAVSDATTTWVRDRLARHSLLHQWSNF